MNVANECFVNQHFLPFVSVMMFNRRINGVGKIAKEIIDGLIEGNWRKRRNGITQDMQSKERRYLLIDESRGRKRKGNKRQYQKRRRKEHSGFPSPMLACKRRHSMRGDRSAMKSNQKKGTQRK